MALVISQLEESIARHLEAGDLRAAATDAMRGYGPEILGYLCAVLRDEDDAADSFSRFAEDLWKGLPAYQRISSFRSWAYKIAWNAACDQCNDAFRRRGRRLNTGELSGLAAEVRSSTDEYLKPGARDRLRRLREALTPEEQTLLVLRTSRALSWKEVAEVLSPPGGPPVEPATLRKRFERLKEKLRSLAQAEKVRD